MKDADCVDFLRWALPRLGMRWQGFRNVRGQVCKRLQRRLDELGLAALADYRDRLERDAAEWQVLDGFCRITISRFYRDRRVFDVLGGEMLPDLAAKARQSGCSLRMWSAGCASGEEAYTLALVWNRRLRPQFPEVECDIVASDTDPAVLARAVAGCYDASSVRDLPEVWRSSALERRGGLYCVPATLRQTVSFVRQDVRRQVPDGTFDVVLCRNLAFTYFDDAGQLDVLRRIVGLLRPSGCLVIGAHEALPAESHGFEPLAACSEIFRYVPAAGVTSPGRAEPRLR